MALYDDDEVPAGVPAGLKAISTLDIGDSVAVARRIEIKYGFEDGAIERHKRQVRGNLDKQTDRARKMHKDRSFKVENGSFITQDGAYVMVAVVTRTA